jgi:steroid 5-alpha reductase family enzyme
MFLAASSPLPAAGLLHDLRFCAGVALFASGFLVHVWSDHALRNLRKPGELGYTIPRGGLFEYVSSPNYFGEIAEWSGWALASWSLPGLAFAVFTAANLVPRAHANRAWYIARFPDYPRERKRVIPFIF